MDGLFHAIVFDDEILGLELVDDPAVLVFDQGRHQHSVGPRAKQRLLLRVWRILGHGNSHQQKQDRNGDGGLDQEHRHFRNATRTGSCVTLKQNGGLCGRHFAKCQLLFPDCCYVPSSQLARYSSSSGVSRSILTPMDSSFTRATFLSTSSGTGYHLCSRFLSFFPTISQHT